MKNARSAGMANQSEKPAMIRDGTYRPRGMPSKTKLAHITLSVAVQTNNVVFQNHDRHVDVIVAVSSLKLLHAGVLRIKVAVVAARAGCEERAVGGLSSRG